MSKLGKLLMTIALAELNLSANQAGSLVVQQPANLRAENGVIVNIQNAQTVDVYDITGRLLVGIDPLKSRPDNLPKATGVSVYDAAVRRDQAVAIAATYASPGMAPQAELLVYDFLGELKSSVALPSSREIYRLAFDDRENIWTMTLGCGPNGRPADVPMIVEYSSSGNELRSLLTRDTFPIHAKLNKGSVDHGFPTLGFGEGVLWFWMPESNDLVTIQADTGSVERVTTGAPPLPRGIAPVMLFRVSPKVYILKTAQTGTVKLPPGRPLYTWSSDSNQWKQVGYPSACRSGYNLIGTLDQSPLFINYDSGALCSGQVGSKTTEASSIGGSEAVHARSN